MLGLVACARPSPTRSPVPFAAPDASAAPAVEPGRPYDAAAILDAMRTSRRPGGVPAELQTEPIAAAIAAELWTWNGDPWTTLTIGGACGPERCSLDVSGVPTDSGGEDVYQLEISDGAVSVAGSQLEGFPDALRPQLEEIARDGTGNQLDGLVLRTARWLAPPQSGKFVLAFRSGGEEGSPALDVTVDLDSRSVLDARQPTSSGTSLDSPSRMRQARSASSGPASGFASVAST
jgi:hypothetical protein